MMLLHLMQHEKLLPNLQKLPHLEKKPFEVKMVKKDQNNPE